MHKFLCCLLSGLLAVAAVCLPIGSSVAAEQQISRTGITISEDTVLQLELMNFLESKRNKVGDTVSVKLLEAVSVADEVIIPKGTVLEGYLKKVQKGKLLSQKGVIRMRLKDYYLPNGYLLRLNNEEIKFSGDMNYTSLAAGVAVPFAGLAFKENLYRIICRRLKDILSSSDWKILNEIIQKNNTDTFSRVANSFE